MANNAYSYDLILITPQYQRYFILFNFIFKS